MRSIQYRRGRAVCGVEKPLSQAAESGKEIINHLHLAV
jgi:hypothetical protein